MIKKLNVLVLMLTMVMTLPVFAEQPASAPESSQQLALPSGDLDAPTVTHTPPRSKSDDGKVTFSANVVDNVAVKSVKIFYRAKGQAQYDTRFLEKQDGDNYSITLPVGEPNLEYYIQAEDSSGNTLLHGYAFSPIVLSFSDHKAEVVSDPSKSISDFGMAKNEPIYKNKWLWIGVGIALGAVALSSGSDDSGAGKPTSTSVIINGPAP